MSETPKYYITRGDNQSGPFTNSELRRKAATGRLLPTDLIFKDGMSEWVKAKRVKGLFPAEEQKPILEPRFVEDFEPELSGSESIVNNSGEFEDTAKKSFAAKAKSFIISSVVICGFLFFLTAMSFSIVTTKEQRAELRKRAEIRRIEREKVYADQEKIRVEKELFAKQETIKNEAEAKQNNNEEEKDVFFNDIDDLPDNEQTTIITNLFRNSQALTEEISGTESLARLKDVLDKVKTFSPISNLPGLCSPGKMEPVDLDLNIVKQVFGKPYFSMVLNRKGEKFYEKLPNPHFNTTLAWKCKDGVISMVFRSGNIHPKGGGVWISYSWIEFQTNTELLEWANKFR
jgi:hypothetical protein